MIFIICERWNESVCSVLNGFILLIIFKFVLKYLDKLIKKIHTNIVYCKKKNKNKSI